MKRKLIKSAATIMAAAMLMTTSAFASEFNVRGPAGHAFEISESSMAEKISFNDLVEKGIVSQDTADKMQAFLDEKSAAFEKAIEDKTEIKNFTERKDFTERPDIYNEMQEAGIINEDEESKIKEYYQSISQAMYEEQLVERLNRYKDEGIINADKLSEIKDLLLNNFKNNDFGVMAVHSKAAKTEFALNSNETVDVNNGEVNDFEIADEVFIAMNTEFRDPETDLLLEKELITEDQANQMMKSDINKMEAERDAHNEKVLSTLVKEGKITNDEKELITNHLNENQEEGFKFGLDENSADGETIVKNPIFKSLVESGDLSQEKAEIVENALFSFRISVR